MLSAANLSRFGVIVCSMSYAPFNCGLRLQKKEKKTYCKFAYGKEELAGYN